MSTEISPVLPNQTLQITFSNKFVTNTLLTKLEQMFYILTHFHLVQTKVILPKYDSALSWLMSPFFWDTIFVSRGDWCLAFQDSVVVSSLKVKMEMFMRIDKTTMPSCNVGHQSACNEMSYPSRMQTSNAWLQKHTNLQCGG
jgi:hypothetical protein